MEKALLKDCIVHITRDLVSLDIHETGLSMTNEIQKDKSSAMNPLQSLYV